jgi:glycosyltransferase involved in cell wall biosynthesis
MKRENIQIVFIAKSIDGGTGTFIFDLLKIRKMFSPNKVSIKVISLEKPSFRKTPESNNFIYLRKENFYPKKYFLSFKNLFNFLEEIFLLKKELSSFEPNLILGVDIHSNLLSFFEKMLFLKNTKLIFTTHINLNETLKYKSDPLTSFILKKFVHFLYDKADLLVCVSKDLASRMKDDFKLKKIIYTIYYGSPNPSSISKNYSKKIIVSAGRLVDQKDYDTLIRSFAMVKKEIPEAKLWIIGDGPLKKRLTNLSINLNLSKDIKFLGWKKNFGSYLRKASLFVLSSKREGFPYVLLEAMSQGLPIISTNSLFGPSEIIENNKYGLLVPIGDANKMKDSIKQLLTSEKEYIFYSKKALERSMFFSKQKMLLGYMKIINHALT